MTKAIENVLRSVRFGEPQRHRDMQVYPLYSPEGSTVEYLTLDEAVEAGLLRVEEMSYHGEVPRLRVFNRAAQPVLLLDGEELFGAKQNRALNTTILLREKSETAIPVSCTEAGRWNYIMDHFVPSGVVMERQVRACKLRSVSRSLECSAQFLSDQGLVWSELDGLHAQAGVAPPTGAMYDAFVSHERELRCALEVFRLMPGQKGLLVVLKGEAVGLDLLSSEAAYVRLHSKLVKSYLLEALRKRADAPPDKRQGQDEAKAFLEESLQCEVREFPSVGYGQDCRFKGARIVGSGLVHENGLIHAAFFRVNGNQPSEGTGPRWWRRRNCFD